MSAPNVDVHIERLVLDGFDHAQGRAIAAAIEQALSARLIGIDGGGVQARRSIGPVEVAAPSHPARIASAVANAVAGGAQ